MLRGQDNSAVAVHLCFLLSIVTQRRGRGFSEARKKGLRVTTFDGLSYSQKQRHVISIVEAKTTETWQRRIAKAVGTLREGRI